MSILMWDKPEKAMSVEKWKSISADSAPPGVYTPNMSKEDKYRWKAKKVGGKYPRVEIRKTFTAVGDSAKKDSKWPHEHAHSEMLMVVSLGGVLRKGYHYSDVAIMISANGPVAITKAEWSDFKKAVDEAFEVLA